MPEERRSNERKRLLLEAKWESMSRMHEARVDDVSLGGCFVNTFGRVELNEAVNLKSSFRQASGCRCGVALRRTNPEWASGWRLPR